MMNLVGKQILDFKAQDGKLVKGVKLHFTDDSRTDIQGAAAVTQFVSESNSLYQKAMMCPLGEFDIRYGYGGKIVDINPVLKGNEK